MPGRGPTAPAPAARPRPALAFADEPAADTLAEAADALVAADDRSGAAEAESTLGWLASVAGRPEAAYAHDERALDLARDTPASPERAQILSGPPVRARAPRRSLALLQETVQIAERPGLRETKAEALQYVGMARLDAGDADGVRDIEAALAVATELSSPVSLSCYGNLADRRRYLGSLAERAR